MSERGGAGAGPQRAVLLLADDHPRHAATTHEHRSALQRLSRHDVHLLNPIALSDDVRLRLSQFDAVIIHYTVVTTMDYFLPPHAREALARFKGLKIQIIQDDYRDVERFRAAIRDLGIGVLFTLVPEHSIERVWPAAELPGVERITTLAGYVPFTAERRVSRPLMERPFDIVYRGRAVPFWLGRLGQDKVRIGQGVQARAAALGLTVDLDWREEGRVYGRRWTELLESGRAALGTESGSSITDFDGSLQSRVESYLAERPNADFDEVHAAILAPYEGNVRMNIISPRVFEAAAARTALVMFPGEYSGVVAPDRDYIVLERDFSNFVEVAERLADVGFLTELTNGVHERLIASTDYRVDRFVDRVDRAIEEHAPISAQRRLHLPPESVAPVGATRRAPIAARLANRVHGVRGSQRRAWAVENLQKVALTLLLAVCEPAPRQLACRWMGACIRGRGFPVGPRRLAEDLLRLGIAARIAAGATWPRLQERAIGIQLDQDPAGVVLRTVPAAGRPTPLGDPFEIAWWDHSMWGEPLHVRLPRGGVIEVWIGDTTTAHRFQTIAALGDTPPTPRKRRRLQGLRRR